MHSATDTSLSLPVNGQLGSSSASVPVDEINVRPARIGRVVYVDGRLLIDGDAVCPVCFEDEDSKFCVCTDDDILALGIGWNRQAVTR